MFDVTSARVAAAKATDAAATVVDPFGSRVRMTGAVHEECRVASRLNPGFSDGSASIVANPRFVAARGGKLGG
jgi:hypothetical protein